MKEQKEESSSNFPKLTKETKDLNLIKNLKKISIFKNSHKNSNKSLKNKSLMKHLLKQKKLLKNLNLHS